ncbi:MAG TPA: M48 family metallopeptidase [Longimicrobiales bacterium]|nr:M48 family metallopeptidase [Longimicrobiales bacterium]
MRRAITIALVASFGLGGFAGCASMPISGAGLVNIGAAMLPIGPVKEKEIGFGIAATVIGRYHMLNDPDLTHYVNLVGQAVAQQSIRGDEVAFHFGVLDTDDVNAFAAPGGFIFVTRGALKMMDSEAELAGVLAHEVGHVDQKHVLNGIRRSSVLKEVKDQTQISGALLDKISAFGTSMLFTGLSREDEMQADSLGVMYAAATGYRADGLVQFLKRLEARETADAANVKASMDTHPPTQERIDALEREMKEEGISATTGVVAADRFRENVKLGG